MGMKGNFEETVFFTYVKNCKGAVTCLVFCHRSDIF